MSQYDKIREESVTTSRKIFDVGSASVEGYSGRRSKGRPPGRRANSKGSSYTKNEFHFFY